MVNLTISAFVADTHVVFEDLIAEAAAITNTASDRQINLCGETRAFPLRQQPCFVFGNFGTYIPRDRFT